MPTSKHHTPPKSNYKLTKKRKVLLGILLPFSIIIIALAIFLGLLFGCKGSWVISDNNLGLVINNDAIGENNGQYKIKAGENIWLGAGDNNKIVLNHDDLDVKAYSDAHNHIKDFVIKGNINFGFMIDPTMNFHLIGESDSKINLNKTTSGNACGVIVGHKTQPTSSIPPYTGIMYIDSSVNFNITGEDAYGVLFNSAASGSTQTINGTFSITGREAYGVFFIGSTDSGSTQTINGTFSITGDESALGVEFFSSTASGSTQTINGTFSITGGGGAGGVGFNSTASGFTTINGTFTIASRGDSDGVTFNSTASGFTTINGTFSITGDESALGVLFNSTASGSTQTINGTFSITSDESALGVDYFGSGAFGSLTINGTFTIASTSLTYGAYGVWFSSSTASGGSTTINGTFTIASAVKAYSVCFSNDTSSTILTMDTAKFFSNKVDSGNIFKTLSTWATKTYEWNNAPVCAVGSPPTSNNSTADGALELTNVVNNTTSPNFAIKVINKCGTGNQLKDNKRTFNTIYKKALQTYIDSSDCPTTAKEWLKEIVKKIITT